MEGCLQNGGLLRLYRQWDTEDQQHPDLDAVLRQREGQIREFLESGDMEGLRENGGEWGEYT